ncbi:hypothetical protein DFH27DRAFT_23269 [Peziza echinospora]|nr:hypothetical protein DFH27DRAFT_23269 [Peziza echinospora]
MYVRRSSIYSRACYTCLPTCHGFSTCILYRGTNQEMPFLDLGTVSRVSSQARVDAHSCGICMDGRVGRPYSYYLPTYRIFLNTSPPRQRRYRQGLRTYVCMYVSLNGTFRVHIPLIMRRYRCGDGDVDVEACGELDRGHVQQAWPEKANIKGEESWIRRGRWIAVAVLEEDCCGAVSPSNAAQGGVVHEPWAIRMSAVIR